MSEKTAIQQMIEGLQILAKYPGAMTCAEHDQLMVGPPDMEVSEEDRAALEALDWFEDSEGGWATFT